MSRSLGLDGLHDALSYSSSPIVEVSADITSAAAQRMAWAAGARFADIGAPQSKAELLAVIATGLGFPDWFGHNWDALEEILASAEPPFDSSILIWWPEPAALSDADPAAFEMFRTIVKSVAEKRLDRLVEPLILAVPHQEPLEQASDLTQRLLVWQVDWTSGFDITWVTTTQESLSARGFIAAQSPISYTAHYRLETGTGLVTEGLIAQVELTDRTLEVDLRQNGGQWWVDNELRPDLEGALDCDLEGCPFTNTMPILRHNLHRSPGVVDFSMAFVRLPTLEVVRSEQRYEHLRLLDDGGAIVRYRSGDFESDLTIDRDGFVVEYPKLGARRLKAAA